MGVLYNRFLPTIDFPHEEEEPAAPAAVLEEEEEIQDHQQQHRATTSSNSTMGATPATLPATYHHHHRTAAPELLIYHHDEYGRSYYYYDDDDVSWNAPDTPEPAEPCLETANGGNYGDGHKKSSSAVAGDSFAPEDDDKAIAGVADADAESEDDEAFFLDATAALVEKLRVAVLAFSVSPWVVWTVNSLYILLGGSVLGATVIFHTLRGFGGIFEPSARLWHGGVGWVLAAVWSVAECLFGALMRGWRYLRAPRDVLEFPVEAPSDPTIYDQETVQRLLMTMKYHDTDEEDDTNHFDWTHYSTIKG